MTGRDGGYGNVFRPFWRFGGADLYPLGGLEGVLPFGITRENW